MNLTTSILYFVGSAFETSGVETIGVLLKQALSMEVILVRMDCDPEILCSNDSLDLPFEISHNPAAVADTVFKKLAKIPERILIVLNNSECSYEAALLLKKRLEVMGVNVVLVALVHSNVETSINLVTRNRGILSRVLAVSEVLSIQIKQLVGDALKVDKSPPFVSLPNRARKDNQCYGPQIRLTYAGRITENQKRFSRIINLINLLRTSGVSFTFDIAGDGDKYLDVERLASENSRYPRQTVAYHGRLSKDQLVSLFERTDVLCLTSDFEGLPLVVIEAMACGVVPVVMNYGEEVREIITDGFNGFVVPRADVRAMAGRIAQLSRESDVRERMGREAAALPSIHAAKDFWGKLVGEDPTPIATGTAEVRSSYCGLQSLVHELCADISAREQILIWGGGHIGRLIVDNFLSSGYFHHQLQIVDTRLCQFIKSYRDVPYIESPFESPHFDKINLAVIASEYFAEEIGVTLRHLKGQWLPDLRIMALPQREAY